MYGSERTLCLWLAGRLELLPENLQWMTFADIVHSRPPPNVDYDESKLFGALFQVDEEATAAAVATSDDDAAPVPRNLNRKESGIWDAIHEWVSKP